MIRRFGLNTSPKLESQAVLAYRRALNSFLLPRLLVGYRNPAQKQHRQTQLCQRVLPLYLMMGGQGPIDSALAKSSIVTLWGSRTYPISSTDSSSKLAARVDALLNNLSRRLLSMARCSPGRARSSRALHFRREPTPP